MEAAEAVKDDADEVDMVINIGAERLGVSRVPQIVNDDTSIISAAATNQPPKF